MWGQQVHMSRHKLNEEGERKLNVKCNSRVLSLEEYKSHSRKTGKSGEKAEFEDKRL